MTDILGQFRDEELPPSRVDIQRAVRSGRRRRRIRTAMTTGGAALALAVAGLTAPALLSHQPDPLPPADTCGSPQPTRSSMATWQRFDPLIAEIDASGVTGHRVVAMTNTSYWQRILLEAGTRTAIVTLFACGGEPYASSPGGPPMRLDPRRGEPADPVGGAAAYWLPQDRPSDPVALAWQWAPGAWATVAVGTGPAPERDELRATATQIAGELNLGAGIRVVSPIALPVPDGMHPVFISVLDHDPGTGASGTGDLGTGASGTGDLGTGASGTGDLGSAPPTGFAIGFDTLDSDVPTNPLVDDYLPDLVITVSRFDATAESRPDDAIPYPEDLGYPAYQIAAATGRNPDPVALAVYEFFGFGVQIAPVDVPGASSTDEKLAWAAGVFRTITAYPNAATDPAAWGPPIVP